MRRLEKDEVRRLNLHLNQWQTPEAMHRLVKVANHTLGSTYFFTQGGLAFIRDAWVAATFASARSADSVRLVSDNWPDFELQLNGRVTAFEVVEADDPDRRRGDEYREDDGDVEYDPVEDWIVRAEQAPNWIKAAARKKAELNYCSGASLVIYLNLSEFGIRQRQVESCFRAETEIAKDAFDAIWVLWKDRAYQTWP